ncbi:MAG: amidohydrolase family protein, partial [Firmicutes bacterium]|nr:amidohydrolase family protein [Bacillota bacterium]
FYLDQWCLDYMKENNVWFVPTLSAMYWIKKNGVEAGIPEWAVKKVNGAFDAHKDSFLRAYKAGIRICLGTDAGTPFNFHDMTAYEMILMVEDGMTPWDAIKSGTINAAQLCQVEVTHGTIEPGKTANLTVYAKDPVSDIHNVMDVCMTVIGGKIAYCK